MRRPPRTKLARTWHGQYECDMAIVTREYRRNRAVWTVYVKATKTATLFAAQAFVDALVAKGAADG